MSREFQALTTSLEESDDHESECDPFLLVRMVLLGRTDFEDDGTERTCSARLRQLGQDTSELHAAHQEVIARSTHASGSLRRKSAGCFLPRREESWVSNGWVSCRDGRSSSQLPSDLARYSCLRRERLVWRQPRSCRSSEPSQVTSP